MLNNRQSRQTEIEEQEIESAPPLVLDFVGDVNVIWDIEEVAMYGRGAIEPTDVGEGYITVIDAARELGETYKYINGRLYAMLTGRGENISDHVEYRPITGLKRFERRSITRELFEQLRAFIPPRAPETMMQLGAAAELLGLTTHAVKKMITNGTIPSDLVGRYRPRNGMRAWFVDSQYIFQLVAQRNPEGYTRIDVITGMGIPNSSVWNFINALPAEQQARVYEAGHYSFIPNEITQAFMDYRARLEERTKILESALSTGERVKVQDIVAAVGVTSKTIYDQLDRMGVPAEVITNNRGVKIASVPTGVANAVVEFFANRPSGPSKPEMYPTDQVITWLASQGYVINENTVKKYFRDFKRLLKISPEDPLPEGMHPPKSKQQQAALAELRSRLAGLNHNDVTEEFILNGATAYAYDINALGEYIPDDINISYKI